MSISYRDITKKFKAMSDSKRLQIIDMLSCGELCACVILESFHITQPTLSHHMKILSEAGLINDRREGKNIYYSLKKEVFDELYKTFAAIYKDKTDCICNSVEK